MYSSESKAMPQYGSSQAGAIIGSTSAMDPQPAVQSSIERLRLAVSRIGSNSERLSQKLAPVLLPAYDKLENASLTQPQVGVPVVDLIDELTRQLDFINSTYIGDSIDRLGV